MTTILLFSINILNKNTKLFESIIIVFYKSFERKHDNWLNNCECRYTLSTYILNTITSYGILKLCIHNVKWADLKLI